MKPVLFYLLQMFIASGLLYGYYHFALRNTRFHRYNRFFLLMLILISTIIPFLNIPVYFSDSTSASSVVFQTLEVISSPAGESLPSGPVSALATPVSPDLFDTVDIAYGLYFVVVLFFALRIVFSIRRINRITKRYPVEQLDKIRFMNTDEPGTPFSFFNRLFWNRKIELNSEKGEQIFRHELFHITQKHSWDVIFIEIITTVFWINPFFHLVKKELKAIHEFLADEFAVRENKNWQYAELLLMQAFTTNHNLINPFFHNQIKRRIAMITLSKEPRYQYLRKVMVLPLAVVIVSLFAFSYKKKNEDSIAGVGRTQVNDNAPAVKLFDNPGSNLVGDTVPRVDSTYFIGELLPPAKKSPTAAQLSSWVDAKMYGVWLDGKRINNTELNKYKPGDFGMYYVSKLTKTAINYGKHYYQVDLYTQKHYDDVFSPEKFRTKVLLKRPYDSTKPLPLIVLNGKARPDVTWDSLMATFGRGKIKILGLLKGKEATDKYGVDAKNGAIEIDTENQVGGETAKEVILEPPQTINKPADEDNKIFVKVEVEPSFKGGAKVWHKYLTDNIKADLPEKSGAPNGTYTVVVQFIVDKDGEISDVKALTSHGYGMEEEAMRVIKKGPAWSPAIQNGRVVKACKKQPITFVVNGGAKNKPLSSNNFDPSSMNFDDAEFKGKWREMISEIKAIAWREGRAAYIYKGRTYVFGRITNPDSTVASFTEQNGIDHVFLLNDELINSVDELNSLIKRSDVKKFGFITKEEALNRFNRKDAIVFIETSNEIITKN